MVPLLIHFVADNTEYVAVSEATLQKLTLDKGAVRLCGEVLSRDWGTTTAYMSFNRHLTSVDSHTSHRYKTVFRASDFDSIEPARAYLAAKICYRSPNYDELPNFS